MDKTLGADNGRPLNRFIITIDTEGDNAWTCRGAVTTRNARYLSRFQSLCERFGFRPTYLVNYEMATCPIFTEFGKDVLRRGVGEIGMHLHAWNSPPFLDLTDDDRRYKPFLIEYPKHVLRAKVEFMTKLLQDVFQVPIVSHRAGRWAMNGTYAQALIDNGYLVDCSVTPHVNWAASLGDPKGSGGTDYRYFPETPYFMSPHDICRPGKSPLLEVPMTVTKRHIPIIGHVLGTKWLRPNGKNRLSMIGQVRCASGYAQFMLHSSELMPGGSPTFPNVESTEGLYLDLEELFSNAVHLKSSTLAEFRQQY